MSHTDLKLVWCFRFPTKVYPQKKVLHILFASSFLGSDLTSNFRWNKNWAKKNTGRLGRAHARRGLAPLVRTPAGRGQRGPRGHRGGEKKNEGSSGVGWSACFQVDFLLEMSQQQQKCGCFLDCFLRKCNYFEDGCFFEVHEVGKTDVESKQIDFRLIYWWCFSTEERQNRRCNCQVPRVGRCSNGCCWAPCKTVVTARVSWIKPYGMLRKMSICLVSLALANPTSPRKEFAKNLASEVWLSNPDWWPPTLQPLRYLRSLTLAESKAAHSTSSVDFNESAVLTISA